MELRQLKYFLAVADSRSFVSAANSLYISRQAVSKSIAQLEEELQVSLFMRDPNGAYLTPAGVMFYERVRNSILELDQIQAEIRQYGAHFRQAIRVVFSIGTLQMFEPQVQQFIRSQSNVSIQYSECTPNECETLLKEHQVDLAITSKPLPSDQFNCQSVYQSEYGVLLRDQEELASLPILEPDDLRWLPIGCFQDGQSALLCEDLNLVPQFTGIDLLRLFCISSDGACATLLPRCLLPKLIPNLCWIPLETSHRWNIYRVHLRSMENNTLFHGAVDAFLGHLFGTTPD